MPAEPTSCPYCNAHLPTEDAHGPDHRVTCPRCGERLASRSPDVRFGSPPVNGVPSLQAFQTGRAPTRRANRAVALAVLGLMVVVAGVGLGFALKTRPERRARDSAPARGTALGYLPGDVNVVAAVQVANALREPSGRSALDWLHVAGGADGRAGLEKQLGLKLEDLEVLVLGVKLAREQSRLTLIVETRAPYDVAAVRAALHATEPAEHAGRLLYGISPEGLPFRVLWRPANNVLVLGMRPEEMEALPLMPSPGPELVAVPLKRLIEADLRGPAQAWVVGYGRDWDRTAPLMLLPGLSGELRASLAQVRTLNFSFQFGQDVALKGTITCDAANAAEALQQAVTPWKKTSARFGITSFEVNRAGAEVTVDARADVAGVREGVDRAWSRPRKRP